MDGTCSLTISRKRKRVQKNRKTNMEIENLPDDCIINILSCMSMKEAGRTSVLSRRWRYLWNSTLGPTLEFSDVSSKDKKYNMRKKTFKRWVNDVLLNRQQSRVDALIVRYFNMKNGQQKSRSIESWISFAMQKEVKRFELEISLCREYELPLMGDSFRFVASLKFIGVKIEDKVLVNLLGSCPNLEELCIRWSDVTKDVVFYDPIPNLKTLEKDVVFYDPIPNLKTLEITKCQRIERLELWAPKLVSLTSDYEFVTISEKCPNLSELTLGSFPSDSFIFEPHLHSSYSTRLVKLRLRILQKIQGRESIDTPINLPQLCSLRRLEMEVFSLVGRGLFFFASLIKASPILQEFRLEISFDAYPDAELLEEFPYPDVRRADAVKIVHENLKLIEICGYIGCSSDDEFLCYLIEIAPTLERVVIDTKSRYYKDLREALIDKEDINNTLCTMAWDNWPEVGAHTRIESKKRAANLATSHNHLPQQIKFFIK